MPEALRIVLHPFHGPGLVEALAARPQLDVVVPDDGDGVIAELESGTAALVTYLWEDDFASGGVEWIQAISAGVDQFSLGLLGERGIVLTSARGAHTPQVAEHAIALMMSAVRGIGRTVRGAGSRTWEPVPAHEVSGRTMAILGLGSIGEAVAEKAAALGMRVIGTKRDPEGYSGIAAEVLPPDGTLEACRRADVLVIALPAAPSTEGLVGEEELRALGAGWLVNVGRGSVVDESALLEALTEGELIGAGLDVTATEPLPEGSPLWDVPNVVITPHMGWSSDRLAGRLADIIARNASAFRGSGEWVNRVV